MKETLIDRFNRHKSKGKYKGKNFSVKNMPTTYIDVNGITEKQLRTKKDKIMKAIFVKFLLPILAKIFKALAPKAAGYLQKELAKIFAKIQKDVNEWHERCVQTSSPWDDIYSGAVKMIVDTIVDMK